jgi:hypothetical protein
MRFKFVGTVLVLAIVALGTVTMVSDRASAQGRGTAASAADVNAFRANPQQLLGSNPQPAQLAAAVKRLVLADPSLVDLLLTLGASQGITPAQASAIGTGIGQAAAEIARTDPAAAERITRRVAAASNPSIVAAFNSAMGLPPTTSAGMPGFGGGAGGPGSGGGGASVVGGATPMGGSGGPPGSGLGGGGSSASVAGGSLGGGGSVSYSASPR